MNLQLKDRVDSTSKMFDPGKIKHPYGTVFGKIKH